MTAPNETNTAYTIAPLGPGDLIDRAVRFYRQNFWTFILIAAPAVIIGTTISVGWMFVARTFLYQSNTYDPFANFGYYSFVWAGNLLIWLTETIATLAVMGGASRNFVRHILFGEAITFKETYKNVLARVWALIIASTVVTLLLWTIGIVILYIGLMIVGLAVVLIAALFSSIPPLAFLFGTVIGIAGLIGVLWLFFLVVSRFAYVPQTITVEGLGAFTAIARSASSASGNIRRFGALFIFTTVAIYSALALLYIPLTWYAWYHGVDIFQFFGADPDLVPAWYEISSKLISQAGFILLSPVWMVGLCLLYVDERVRHEGYDLELMAARRLGEIPDVPQDYLNPLQPALAKGVVTSPAPPRQQQTVRRPASTSTLGLDR